MSRLITCIWFVNNDGEEAAKYYIDTFNSAPGNHTAKLGDVTKTQRQSKKFQVDLKEQFRQSNMSLTE